MQNQPKGRYTIKIEDYPLDNEFPIHVFTYKPKTGNISNVHVHNFLEIGLCEVGSGVFVVDEKVMSFYKGDVTIIFENQLHKAQSTETGSEWCFIYIDIDMLLRELPLKELLIVTPIIQNIANYNNITNSQIIISIVKEILSEIKEKKDNYKSQVKSLMWSLLIQMDRELVKSKHGNILPRTNVSHIFKLAPALEYISENFDKQIDIATLAEKSYMSLTSLRREFANVIHMSPLEYVNELRIKTATLLINTTSKSFCDIAFEVGFASLSSFNRKFKEIIHCSPTEYKKRRSK